MIAWDDRDATWWVKLRRARSHIVHVDEQVADFTASQPWEVVPEPTDRRNERLFRLRVRRPVPSDLIAVIGDAIHNLRSSLDAVAYELAARRHPQGLSQAQEFATEFPIMKDRASLERWANRDQRRGLYGDSELAAFAEVQPFALPERLQAHGDQRPVDPKIALRNDQLHRLHVLSRIDKHRRLPLVSWFNDLVYWDAPPEGSTYAWQPHSGYGIQDGTPLGVLLDPDGDAPPATQVFHELQLALADDPAAPQVIGTTLRGWYGYITGWVIPVAFSVSEGSPPPIVASPPGHVHRL